MERARPGPRRLARARLDEGNRAFASLLDPSAAAARGVVSRVVPIDLSHIRSAPGAYRQDPFAAVLGCADARVPIELVFNVGPNDIFVVRVAGNSLGPDVIGSLKYAISHLGKSLKIVTVLGHSGCGAVSAAVDVFLNPSEYVALATNRAIRSVLDQLATVVHASARKLAQTYGDDIASRPGYRDALIEASIVANAAFTAYTVQQAIHEEGPVGLISVYGVYLLDSCRIWSPKIGSDEWSGLAEPPADVESFARLA